MLEKKNKQYKSQDSRLDVNWYDTNTKHRTHHSKFDGWNEWQRIMWFGCGTIKWQSSERERVIYIVYIHMCMYNCTYKR